MDNKNSKSRVSSAAKNSTKTASKNSVARKNIGSKTAQMQAKSKRDAGQTEFAQEMCKLNDADIVGDILGTHKGLVKMYGTALCEVDCQNLREILSSQLNECADDQFDTFLFMNQRGLYPTEEAPMPKIKQAKKLFASKEKTFN